MTDAATWRSNYERQTHLVQPAIRLKRDADQTSATSTSTTFYTMSSASVQLLLRNRTDVYKLQLTRRLRRVVLGFFNVQRSRHPFVRTPAIFTNPVEHAGDSSTDECARSTAHAHAQTTDLRTRHSTQDSHVLRRAITI